MNIVTSADSNFYHCLHALAQSVRNFYDKKLIVYDIGLTQQQQNSLDAQVIPIEVQVEFHKYTTFRNVPFIQATHKPFCVRHYFQHHCEPMIMVDADCLFMQKVEETGFDAGVTLKPKRKIDTSNYYNGVLNTGVVFFNTPAEHLVEEWIEHCRKPRATDQQALTAILSQTIDWQQYNKTYDWHGLKIRVFPVTEYNDYYLNTGKIFHFKGHRHRLDIYDRLTDALQKGDDPYKLFKQLVKKEKHRGWFRKLWTGTKKENNPVRQ